MADKMKDRIKPVLFRYGFMADKVEWLAEAIAAALREPVKDVPASEPTAADSATDELRKENERLKTELAAALTIAERIDRWEADLKAENERLKAELAPLRKLAEAYLAEHDETPLTEEWLHSIGFRDDRTGCPTLGPLHIRHAHVPKPDSDEEYPPYACVRSFPIPVPKNRSEVITLLRLLGIATLTECSNCGTWTTRSEGHSPCNPKEWSAPAIKEARAEAALKQSYDDLAASGGIVGAP